MPIKKIKSKRYKSGWGFLLSIDRKDSRIRRTFETEKQAKRLEAVINNRALAEAYDLPLQSKTTLAELITEHLEIIKHRSNFNATKRIIEMFANLVGYKRIIRSLKKADLMSYVKRRQKDGMAPQTINRETTEIKAMLNSAWKHFPDLDEYQAPRISRLPEPKNSRSEIWTDEEFIALISVLLRPAEKFEYQEIIDQRQKLAEKLIVMRQTGMRPGEARFLNRKNCDFKRRVIKITSLKGGAPRTREVPMNDEVFEILERRATRGEWIFSNPDGSRPMTEPYNLLKTACKRAGIIYGLKVPGGKIPYDTRKTFENEALENGNTPQAVALVLGHSVTTMVKHYLRTTNAQKKAVVENGKKYTGDSGGMDIEKEEIAELKSTQPAKL